MGDRVRSAERHRRIASRGLRAPRVDPAVHGPDRDRVAAAGRRPSYRQAGELRRPVPAPRLRPHQRRAATATSRAFTTPASSATRCSTTVSSSIPTTSTTAGLRARRSTSAPTTMSRPRFRPVLTPPPPMRRSSKGRAPSRSPTCTICRNDVPRDDGNGTGYPNLMIDTAAFGTADGTAPVAYIPRVAPFGEPARARRSARHRRRSLRRAARERIFPTAAGSAGMPPTSIKGTIRTGPRPTRSSPTSERRGTASRPRRSKCRSVRCCRRS